MRLFLGIRPDEGTQQFLTNHLRQARHPAEGWREVPPENRHVTVLFIGHVDNALTEDVKTALSSIKWPSPFALTFQQFRTIYRHNKPAMGWAQYASGPLLYTAYKMAHEAVTAIQTLPPLQPSITPHITLSRIKPTSPHYPISWPLPNDPPTMPCSHIHLYASYLYPNGAKYQILHSFTLPQNR